ncbi:MAG: Kinase inhibitor [Pseudomonadota bacterium]|jgi:inhibitor of KinA
MHLSERKVPELLPLGDSAWTVQFGSAIDPDIHARVMGLTQRIGQLRHEDPLFKSVNDVVPTFRSLTVHFSASDMDGELLGKQLLELAQISFQKVTKGRHWRLPACFDPSMAPDLSGLAAAKHISEREVIERVLNASLTVYMIGFLPGFPYMGGVPADLASPRLATPRQRVPAQSIALAGEMCAVYPWESPGGWNLIGRTPVPFFDLRDIDQPALLSAGDRVSWFAVTTDEYAALSRQCESGEIKRETFLMPEGFK